MGKHAVRHRTRPRRRGRVPAPDRPHVRGTARTRPGHGRVGRRRQGRQGGTGAELVRPMPAMRQTRRQDRKHLAMLVEQKRQGRFRQMDAERGMRLQDLRGEIRQETYRQHGPPHVGRQTSEGVRPEIKSRQDVRRALGAGPAIRHRTVVRWSGWKEEVERRMHRNGRTAFSGESHFPDFCHGQCDGDPDEQTP